MGGGRDSDFLGAGFADHSGSAHGSVVWGEDQAVE